MRRCRDRVNTGFSVWANIPVFVLLFSKSQPPASRTKFNTDTSTFLQRQVFWKDSCIFQCFTGSSQSKRHCAWYVSAIFGAYLCFPIKVGNFSGDLYG